MRLRVSASVPVVIIVVHVCLRVVCVTFSLFLFGFRYACDAGEGGTGPSPSLTANALPGLNSRQTDMDTIMLASRQHDGPEIDGCEDDVGSTGCGRISANVYTGSESVAVSNLVRRFEDEGDNCSGSSSEVSSNQEQNNEVFSVLVESACEQHPLSSPRKHEVQLTEVIELTGTGSSTLAEHTAEKQEEDGDCSSEGKAAANREAGDNTELPLVYKPTSAQMLRPSHGDFSLADTGIDIDPDTPMVRREKGL